MSLFHLEVGSKIIYNWNYTGKEVLFYDETNLLQPFVR